MEEFCKRHFTRKSTTGHGGDEQYAWMGSLKGAGLSQTTVVDQSERGLREFASSYIEAVNGVFDVKKDSGRADYEPLLKVKG